MNDSTKEIVEYLRSITWKEGVVVEYSPSEPIHFIFKWLVNVSRKFTENVLVLDILDILPMIKLSLEVAGEDTSFMDTLDVIKGGGSINVGRIIGYLDPYQDPTVYMAHYMRILREYYKEHRNVVYFIFGVEKLVHLRERREEFELYITNYMRYVLGNEDRIGVYFINKNIATDAFRLQAEEAASRVLEISHEKGILKVSIKKSPRLEDHGKEFKIPFEDLLLSEV